MWRTRLRTMELHGIAKAIEILSSDDAKKTFEAASTTFLQLSIDTKASNSEAATSAAYERLKALATKYGSLSLAKLAITVHSGGHFDKVLAAIDKMIKLLREEAQLDVKDRDFCEQKQGKNKKDLEDNIEKLTETIGGKNRESREGHQENKGKHRGTDGNAGRGRERVQAVRQRRHRCYQTG